MSARNIISLLRQYSTPKKPAFLWVKHNGNQPEKVPFKGCADMADFAKKVRKELGTNCRVALFTSLDKQPINSWLKMADLLTSDLKNNSGESPLFVKLSPVVQDAIVTKIIYIRNTNDDGKFTDDYIEYKVKNNENLRDIYKFGLGLVHLSAPKKAIVDFDDIKDGERYQVYKYWQDFQGWQKKEADAMESETLLSMKSYLADKLGASPVDLPTDFHGADGRQIQEWDGALLSGEKLYLLEAKHSMSEDKLEEIAARVKAFTNVLKESQHKHLAGKFSKAVGVVCGTFSPDNTRKEAHRLGLVVVYPSGRRYVAETSKMDSDFAIER